MMRSALLLPPCQCGRSAMQRLLALAQSAVQTHVWHTMLFYHMSCCTRHLAAPA